MRQVIKTAMVALAVAAFSAVMATGAAAFHPLFLNASGKTLLLFTDESGSGALRGEEVGIAGVVMCENNLLHGFTQQKSTLAHLIEIEVSGKCEQVVGSTKSTCTEPIKLKLADAELGLLSSSNHKVVLLIAPESGTTFAEFTCGGNKTSVTGAIVIEVPETNINSVNQYNKSVSELEVFINTEKENNKQELTGIDLLGTEMTKAELSLSGFFGGKAALETSDVLKPDGQVEISTK